MKTVMDSIARLSLTYSSICYANLGFVYFLSIYLFNKSGNIRCSNCWLYLDNAMTKRTLDHSMDRRPEGSIFFLLRLFGLRNYNCTIHIPSLRGYTVCIHFPYETAQQRRMSCTLETSITYHYRTQ